MTPEDECVAFGQRDLVIKGNWDPLLPLESGGRWGGRRDIRSRGRGERDCRCGRSQGASTRWHEWDLEGKSLSRIRCGGWG